MPDFGKALSQAGLEGFYTKNRPAVAPLSVCVTKKRQDSIRADRFSDRNRPFSYVYAHRAQSATKLP